MKRFIFFLLILLVSVFIGVKIAEDPGYALFAYRHWTVEMPLWFMVVGVIVFLLVLYCMLRFIDGVDATWAGWKNWLRLRKKHKSYSKTNRGILELLEANWKSAENCLMAGVDQSDAPLINFLAAAKAAQEQNAFDRRDAYLRKAYDVAPQANVAIGITQAQLQLNQGKYEQALATLNHLRSLAPKHAFVLKMLERVYIHLGDWKSLLNLLPALRKAKIASEQHLEQLQNKVYQELLSRSQTASVFDIKKIWDTVPKKFQQDPEVVAAYTKVLSSHPETWPEIDELITKAMKKSWNTELVHLYGVCITEDATKQLKTAENWKKFYGTEPVLFLTLGRLCVRCQQWGKARSYFEESLKLAPTPEIYLEYGNLLLRLNEQDAAMKQFKIGMVQTASKQ